MEHDDVRAVRDAGRQATVCGAFISVLGFPMEPTTLAMLEHYLEDTRVAIVLAQEAIGSKLKKI